MNNENIKEQVDDVNGAKFPMPAEPWKANHIWIFDNNKIPITQVGSVWLPSRTREATAKRIVECVNAMQGIEDPQTLRDTWDAIQHLELDAYHKMKEQRDELLYALDNIKFFVDKDFPPIVPLGQRSDEYTAAWEKMNEVLAKVMGGQA